ncbi:uncharacterized protein LOC141613099 [Silene latifolia]|uniref:uncharacterized protein LOC141613099 n=1 Tax=Silene latifolia TaxID=37657 RepID=UPI003D77CF58
MAETSAMNINENALQFASLGTAADDPDIRLNEGLSHWFSFKASGFIKARKSGYYERRDGACSYKFELERDVRSLQQQLQEEIELHATLEHAMKNKFVDFSTPSHFPEHTIDLLTTIVTLEDTVSKLEEKMLSLQFQLSQERNERRLVEYRLQRSYSKKTPSPSLKENQFSKEMHPENSAPVNSGKLTKQPSSNRLWNHPNLLSEEMVRCMRSIFISLAECPPSSNSTTMDSPRLTTMDNPRSPHAQHSNTLPWSLSEHLMVPMWAKSPQIELPHDSEVLGAENAFDPYKVSGKLSWLDIGRYEFATEVFWMSVGKRQLEYAAGSLRRFRILVEQLAKVNPILLSSDEKLAFWVNLYNALLMHAYLAYGVPRSESKFFSLLQKAAYTVGGHLFSAAVIEYVILKMRPPIHRPQIALLLPLHKLKVSEEQKKFAIDSYEPNVAFALSCGMYSSPAVQVLSAKNVRDELEAAQRDFIRASVGVSCKGKLLVPKMLHGFARNYVDDSKLAQWISRYLTPEQAAFIEQNITQKRQKLFSSRNCGVLSFDSRFRYLFLPDTVRQQ